MHPDFQRLYIGVFGSILGEIANASHFDYVRFFGGLASAATAAYMTTVTIQKIKELRSSSRNERDK